MMPLRGLSGLVLLAACAGCSAQTDETPPAAVAEGDETIACAVGGATEMKDVCAIERVKAGDALQLVVHHPDGAFRRFDVRSDGSGLAPADGAEEPERRIENGMLEISVGADKYRFPATIADHAATP